MPCVCLRESPREQQFRLKLKGQNIPAADEGGRVVSEVDNVCSCCPTRMVSAGCCLQSDSLAYLQAAACSYPVPNVDRPQKQIFRLSLAAAVAVPRSPVDPYKAYDLETQAAMKAAAKKMASKNPQSHFGTLLRRKH